MVLHGRNLPVTDHRANRAMAGWVYRHFTVCQPETAHEELETAPSEIN